MRASRARAYAIDVATAQQIDAALRRFGDELGALIGQLPADAELAAHASLSNVDFAATRLEARIATAVRTGTDVAFDDTLAVWDAAMQRVARSTVKDATVGAVVVPQLTIAQSFGGERTTSTFSTLLHGHTLNASAEVAAITRRALLQGMSPEELALLLKPYVMGRDSTPGALYPIIATLPVGTRGAAYSMEHNAKRIAFSETHNARREAEVQHFQRDPHIALGRWTLSPNRGTQRVPDVCDALAKLDWYGLGAGVFPLTRIPGSPHPWDRCEVMPLTWTPELKALLGTRRELTLLLNPATVELPGEERLTPRAVERIRIQLALLLNTDAVTLVDARPKAKPPEPTPVSPKLAVVPPTPAAEPKKADANPFADRKVFATEAEAREYANNVLGAEVADKAPPGKARVWGKAAPSAKARLAQLNVIVSELDALYAKFPSAPKATKKIFTTHPTRGRAHLAGPGWLAVNEPRGEASAAAARNFEAATGKRWGIGSDKGGEWQQRTVTRHEYSHNLSTPQALAEWERVVSELQRRGIAVPRKEWFKRNVSEYSGTNRYEEIAESFALVTEPNYANGSLPIEIEQYVIKYLLGGA